MSNMRSLLWVVLAGSGAVAACSSDDSGGGGSGGGAGTGNYFLEPQPNGLPMSEAAACDLLRKSEINANLAKSCGPITRPPCPSYLVKGNEACLEYDQGTVSACANFIQDLPSCEALKSYQCVVQPIAGSAPNGCPMSDAGSDGAVDAASDAPADTGVTVDSGMDAGTDSGTDAALVDTGVDAPVDSGPADASSD